VLLSITVDTAIRLGRAFGTTPAFWMNLQTRFDLDTARVENIDKIVPIIAAA
jgi:addiction module HigA family antidote